MTPRKWISPERDRPVDGELRIVKLESGQLRAARWHSSRAYTDRWGWYADRNGVGIDYIVAVGEPS